MKLSSIKYLNLLTGKLREQIEYGQLLSLFDYVNYIQEFNQVHEVYYMECSLKFNDDRELIGLVFVDMDSKQEREIVLKPPYESFANPLVDSFDDLAELLRSEVEQHKRDGMRIYLEHVFKYNQTTEEQAELKVDHIRNQAEKLVLINLITGQMVAYELNTDEQCELVNPKSIEDSGLGDEIGVKPVFELNLTPEGEIKEVRQIDVKDQSVTEIKEVQGIKDDRQIDIKDNPELEEVQVTESKDNQQIESKDNQEIVISEVQETESKDNQQIDIKDNQQIESKDNQQIDINEVQEIEIKDGLVVIDSSVIISLDDKHSRTEEDKPSDAADSPDADQLVNSLSVHSPVIDQQVDLFEDINLNDDIVDVEEIKKKLPLKIRVTKFLLKYMFCIGLEEDDEPEFEFK